MARKVTNPRSHSRCIRPRDVFAGSSPLRRWTSNRAFSLLELIVVMAITFLLMGLLLPVLSHVRENVHRVICASDLRQIGLAVMMYARDEKEQLPYSAVLKIGEPQELMAANPGDEQLEFLAFGGWDGMGRLFASQYCGAPGTYYCPSHSGNHGVDEYEFDWQAPQGRWIYTNYHYAGHVDWTTDEDRSLDDGDRLVIAADGFREPSDINHETGFNVVRGDGSVLWIEDGGESSFSAAVESSVDDEAQFEGLWSMLESMSR